MSAFDKVIPLFKAKGWHLYRGRPGTDFPAIVMQGRATTIERGTFYHVLPATLRDESFDEVAGHLSFAHQSNQLPTYNDRANPPSIVRGVLETDDGFAIVPADDDNKGSQFHGYEFDLLRIEDAVKFNMMRQTASSRSNSAHSARRNSPGLTNTSGANRNAAWVTGSPLYELMALSNAPTSLGSTTAA